jgi:hypothetical protein
MQKNAPPRISGQWDEFTAYRIGRENARLYPHGIHHDVGSQRLAT